jgi:hypothetical protein
MKTRKTTLRLPLELVVAARRRASQEGCSMRAVIETALRRYLKRRGGDR